MNRARLVFGMIGASLWCVGAGAVELPAGPNKDVVARACGSCHDLDMVRKFRADFLSPFFTVQTAHCFLLCGLSGHMFSFCSFCQASV